MSDDNYLKMLQNTQATIMAEHEIMNDQYIIYEFTNTIKTLKTIPQHIVPELSFICVSIIGIPCCRSTPFGVSQLTHYYISL